MKAWTYTMAIKKKRSARNTFANMEGCPFLVFQASSSINSDAFITFSFSFHFHFCEKCSYSALELIV